ncbi:formate dehydrogenase [Actinomadura craniellae]|uniref:Formate dehydrogenase n=1 Tax=Actinomadura craniellae TaxID=2231787 RepID=A0A365GVQ6_9ACTN|nr:cytochrome b/b6 domain-containing protein [Actinomadura craniellae]RAY10838.1 formate dehydrogenase [Actinomadura craniellae]
MKRPERRLRRFTRAELAVHHATAALMIICLVTAACLYVPEIAAAVGRRGPIKTLHVVAGLALPLPVLLGWASRAFREDVRLLNRFGRRDRDWLRGRPAAPGKFNAGQKLNAAFVAGAILVMFGTGVMLTWPGPWPDRLRTGATFVHDWLTIAILVMFLGHLWFAMRDRGALAGITTGTVDARWAARHHPAWDAVRKH